MFNLGQFLIYVAVTTITPGPNTLSSMANGIRLGFRGARRFLCGVVCGQMIVVLLAGVFSRAMFAYFPGIKPYMLALGAAYILYLAWKIWRSGAVQAEGKAAGSFVSGLLLQFMNPKYILFAITAMSVYILPYGQTLPAVLPKAALLPLAGLASCALWAACGSMLSGFYNQHAKLLNGLIALALVYCALALFF